MVFQQGDNTLSRRQFLKAAAGGALGLTVPTLAQRTRRDDSYQIDDLDLYDFVMPRVRFTAQKRSGQGQGPDVWNVRPGGDANLLRRLSTVIRCKTKPIIGANNWQPQWARDGQLNAVVTFDRLEYVKKYPFLFMTGENYFEFTENQKQNLKDYIMRGGFMLMDDCVVGSGGDFFYQSAFRMLEQIFGRGSVRRLSNDHEVFHNVYDLGDTALPSMEYVMRRRRSGLPYMHGQNHGARGIFIGDRLAVFLSSTDLHCGWCDSQGIEWGLPNYEKAIQMGINVIMYAITH